MKNCLIISGGDYCDLPKEIEYNYVIACDKGLDYAERLNIVPDLIIGDFDSCNSDLSRYDSSRIQTFPSRKDDSDTLLAVKHAISMGCKHISVICALGGRLDHTMANIQTLTYAAANNVICEIISDNEHLIACSSPAIDIKRVDGYSLSLFSMTDECRGVSISGAGYNVSDVSLTNTFPIGLSNYWTEEYVHIRLESGILLIVMSKM